MPTDEAALITASVDAIIFFKVFIILTPFQYINFGFYYCFCVVLIIVHWNYLIFCIQTFTQNNLLVWLTAYFFRFLRACGTLG